MTHALLVVSGWGRFSLNLGQRFWLPDCRFLRFALHEAIAVEDVEMTGEILHVGCCSFVLVCLCIFSSGFDCHSLLTVISFLVAVRFSFLCCFQPLSVSVRYHHFVLVFCGVLSFSCLCILVDLQFDVSFFPFSLLAPPIHLSSN